jgi:hypothetical protein
MIWHLLNLIALYCSLVRPTYSTEWVTRGYFNFVEGSVGPAIIDYIGGVEQFELEVAEVVAHASNLRNNIPAHWSKYGSGGGGLIAKICFEDGVCWADKMFGYQQAQSGTYGEAVMRLVREYCPNIPLPESKAWFSKNGLTHHMTEWVEGKPLYETVFRAESGCYFPNATTFRIPNKIVKSLAQFVYNLTTCPIPNDLRTSPLYNELTHKYGELKSPVFNNIPGFLPLIP